LVADQWRYSVTLNYNEQAVLERIALLSRSGKAAVAAAAAERLFPLYLLYSRAAPETSDSAALRKALDDVWSVALSGEESYASDPYEVALPLIPDVEDPSWIAESAFAQNAAIAVAYAWRAWTTDDAQEAVWGLRQSVEAADFAAESGTWGANSGLTPETLVDVAVEAIEHDVALAETSADDFTALMKESGSPNSWPKKLGGWAPSER
jgi:hypothetical protein